MILAWLLYNVYIEVAFIVLFVKSNVENSSSTFVTCHTSRIITFC